MPVGRAVALDMATIRKTRPNVAKVCVEIDVSKPRFDRIWIEIVNGGGELRGYWQRVEYRRAPMYWDKCGRFGHGLNNCRRLGVRLVTIGVEVTGERSMGGGDELVKLLVSFFKAISS